jgi:allantoinase
VPARSKLEDHGELAVMPGVVDTHVHLNEPGRTEWEGFSTATRAAAIGGVTTLVDMPLNSIPATTSREAFAAKRAAAEGQCSVDVGFWGGVVPGNASELAGMVADGVRGFKCFLVESGVAEFGWVGEADLRPAMGILANEKVPLLVHAEVIGPIDAATARLANADPRKYRTYLESRPPAAEEQAIALVTGLCRETRARTHIVHHSAASALSQLEAARAEGLPLTVETCPHYLHFIAEAIPDGATRSSARRRSATPRIARRCGARSRAACSISSLRITRRAAPRSSRWRSATTCRRGAASPACSSRSRSCGPKRARAVTRWSTSRAGCRRDRRSWPASSARKA